MKTDRDFLDIINFFVLHSPCEILEAMYQSFQEYGQVSPWRNARFINQQFKNTIAGCDFICFASTYKELNMGLEKADMQDNFPSNLEKERICVYNNQKTHFGSIFYHVSNAFSQGEFQIFQVRGKKVFALESQREAEKNRKNRIVARMILKESTLLKWISIVEYRNMI